MFDLFLRLFNLFIPQLNRILLLLNLLYRLLKLPLNLIQSAELMFQLVFLLGDFLYLPHECRVLLGHLLDVARELRVEALLGVALRLVLDDVVLRLDQLLPQGCQLLGQDDH
jgi:hypothetical protein